MSLYNRTTWQVVASEQHQVSGICAYYFPHFVRDLGQIWYK
ncbi:hypothetical protein HMPREF1583_00436, partial [Gardnerella vaginalis JCP8151B]